MSRAGARQGTPSIGAPTRGPARPDRDRPATLTVAQTAQLLGISVRATYRAIENGHIPAIPAIRLGRRIRVPTAPLEHLLGLRREPDADVEREAS